MAKIFLDIGGHLGETLVVAMQPRWQFDQIHVFEPAPECRPTLVALSDERVVVHPFGLWTETGSMSLYDPGEIGASLFAAKRTGDWKVQVNLRDAAEWFVENIATTDEVIVKINCEGAECDILDRLCDSQEIAKVTELLVHFDVRKIPGEEHREVAVRRRLASADISYRPAEAIMFGRNVSEKTANWLSWYHARGLTRLWYSTVKRIEFFFRVRLYKIRNRPVTGAVSA